MYSRNQENTRFSISNISIHVNTSIVISTPTTIMEIGGNWTNYTLYYNPLTLNMSDSIIIFHKSRMDSFIVKTSHRINDTSQLSTCGNNCWEYNKLVENSACGSTLMLMWLWLFGVV